MEWYIPITILPGIALLILSTSNFIIALNNEIKELKTASKAYEIIIKLKIAQLKRLSYSIGGLYVCALLFTLAGMLAVVLNREIILFILLILAICIMSVSIIGLLIFAFKAVKIREKHLKLEHK